jgi:hypothetical protein
MDVRRANTDVRWVGFHPLVFWSINLDNNYERGCSQHDKIFKNTISYFFKCSIEQHLLDTNAGKQLS